MWGQVYSFILFFGCFDPISEMNRGKCRFFWVSTVQTLEMNHKRFLKNPLQFALIFALLPVFTSAQCELFKSEITGVKSYIEEVSQLADSLHIYAESAAFAAQYKTARQKAIKAQIFAGETLSAAYEAVAMAAEAQYYSEVCGIDGVKSNAIDAESHSIDARDFANAAFTNAKKAIAARNLGDVNYYMRKSLDAGRQAKKAAEAAIYSASDANLSCNHDDVTSAGNDK